MSVVRERQGESGFGLIAVVVAIFLVLLAMGVAAPAVSRSLRREREVEAIHRGNQYVRAVQLYYRKFGHYPGNMDQLEKSNNIRFLRQKYADPMTGKPDWRLIHVGEQKTTVKGFFGQPLAGIAATGIAGSTGMGSPIGGGSQLGGSAMGGGTSTSPMGASSTPASGTGVSTSATSTVGGGGGATGATATGGSTSTGSTSGNSSTGGSGFGSIGSQSATSFGGSGAPFLGIGSSAGGDSITVLNEQTTYPTWEFIYDPRIEQLKQKANLLGGGGSSGSGLGQGFSNPGSNGSNSPFNNSTNPMGPTSGSPNSPTNSTSPTSSPSNTRP